MDCHQIEFSSEKSQERINKILQIFPRKLLMHILAFALHLMGAKRKQIAALVGMSEGSVKTMLRLVSQDGFSALRDRRFSSASLATTVQSSPPQISACRDDTGWTVEFGGQESTLNIAVTHTVQARTILLSMLNANLLSAQQCASVLGMSAAHCRDLARKLTLRDVPDALIDKRVGQQSDYRVGPEQKAEIIQQLVARTITGHNTSSEILAEQVNELTGSKLSARTIRWHIHNLGLAGIKKTLPQWVEYLKKTPAVS
jgi:hypothetical protein